MPVIKSARKKLRQDKKREQRNNVFRNALKLALKNVKKNASPANISRATKTIDKLAKKNIIHKNKAARMKYSLSKLLPKSEKSSVKSRPAKTKSKTSKKK